MTELFYAGLIIEITGIIGIGIGIFDLLSKKKKPRGFGNLTVHFKVKDVLAYNKDVGKLWIAVGALICLDGVLLLFDNPESRSVFVALAAVAVYTLASVYYVMVIEKKHILKPDEEELWKDVKKKQQ